MSNFKDGCYSCTAGTELLAKVIAGKCQMHYTRAAVGCGKIPAGKIPEAMIEPADYVMDAMISNVSIPVDGQCQVTVQLNSKNAETAFLATCILLYAQDPDIGEVPYTYLVLENNPEWIKSADSDMAKLAVFDLITAVGSIESVSADIAPDAVITRAEVDDIVSRKVDKVSGKGLSTEDFTTAEKNKLSGIAPGAAAVSSSEANGNIKINGVETTVYTHPSGTNPHGTTKADVGLGNVGDFKAVSTYANQSLTDSEQANARANIDAARQSSTYSKSETEQLITQRVSEIVANSPEDFDTLKEISDWIGSHENSAAAMNSAISANSSAISTKADKSNTYTKSEVDSALNNKVDKISGKGLSTEDYTTAEKNKLSGIASGATANVGTITGIKMNGASKGSSGVVDLGTVITAHQDISGKANVGHTHAKSDITDFPASLPASDVYSWAKQSSKPSYSASEISGLGSMAAKSSGDYSPVGHKHTKSDITDFPSSMPASDVYPWAKAASKPSYNADEVGAAAASHSHSYNDLSNKPTIPTTLPASDVYPWAKAASKPSYTASEVGAAAASHSHSYNDLSNKPTIPTTLPASDVYAWAKAASKPSYNASEVGAASSSDLTVTGVGALSSQRSFLGTFYDGSKFYNAINIRYQNGANYGMTIYSPMQDNSDGLYYTKQNGADWVYARMLVDSVNIGKFARSSRAMHTTKGIDGQAGWAEIGAISVGGAYVNSPFRITVTQRGLKHPYFIDICFSSTATPADTVVNDFTLSTGTPVSTGAQAYIIKTTGTTPVFRLYVKKTQAWDIINILDIIRPHKDGFADVNIAWGTSHLANVSGGLAATDLGTG